MQIIDELEEARRGPYCGSVGVFLPDGSAMCNIAIRTACITGERDHAGMLRSGTLDWWVGAGIVADSTPEGEWAETLAKAAVLRAAIGSGT
jgi:anthranilate/para-aminobenzoate synthase component I